MKLLVSKVSEVTSKNNRILTLTNEEVVKTPFGTKTAKRTFCMAVEDGTQPEVGFEAELALDEYNIVNRESVDEDGTIFHVNWLHCK